MVKPNSSFINFYPRQNPLFRGVTGHIGCVTMMVVAGPIPDVIEEQIKNMTFVRDKWIAYRGNGRLRIVLADGQEVARLGLATALKSSLAPVILAEAGDVTVAQELCRAYQPHVLVLDPFIKEFCPIEVIANMKKQSPATAVIILTPQDLDAYLTTVLQAGAAGFFLKEGSLKTIIEAVCEAGQGKNLFSFEQLRRAQRWQQTIGQRWDSLTQRERQVLLLLSAGKHDEEIAKTLHLARKTTSNHVSNIISKLEVTSRLQAALWFEKEIPPFARKKIVF